MKITLPAETFFPLLFLCFMAGYLVALTRAKRLLKKEAETLAKQILDAKDRQNN